VKGIGTQSYHLLNRESGITLWALEEFKRARALWEHALSYSSYDFEYRLAIVSPQGEMYPHFY
jgi:hypothetical protein